MTASASSSIDSGPEASPKRRPKSTSGSKTSPSNELRKWFAHDPKKWPEFKRKYVEELKTQTAPLALLRHEVSQGPVTLVYGARDEEHNEAVVLLDLLQRK
jgi:uncharacterized protein YeaO (DUF488 family)